MGLALDMVKVEQTYKHPCLFTITVDAFRSQHGTPASTPQQDMSEWHLPTPDPNNQGKYMYRIRTIDVYLWTPDDASMFLDSLRRILQPHQLQIVTNPQAVTPTSTLPEHKHDTMSPVIANLERAAISHSSRTPSVSATPSFPGPPSAPPPGRTPTASPLGDATHYAPMAYNPAAPAAPEPIAHREKTPPPPDAADGTGLGAAVHGQFQPQYNNPLQASFGPQPTSGPYTPGPPGPGHGFSGFTGPPQSPPSFAPPPPSSPPSAPQSPPQTLPGQRLSGHQSIASPPPGGYSQFQYGSTSPATPDATSVHQQIYRPTEHEATIVGHDPVPTGEPNSNMGKRVSKVEKGVGRFLKKLDKSF
jgi:hypothetical protein